MEYTVENLRNAAAATQPTVLESAIALFEGRYNVAGVPNEDQVISKGTAEAIRKKFERGEAVVMTMKDESGKLAGASFTVIPKKGDRNPAVGVYTYEAVGETAPAEARADLLAKSIEAVHAETGAGTRLFFEGNKDEREADENLGFRRIGRFDSWNDEYKWMVHGDTPPSQKEMETAVHLQRTFVALSMTPEEVNPANPLPLQISENLRSLENDGYGVNESIRHVGTIATPDGQMELDPLAPKGQSKSGAAQNPIKR